MHLHHHHHHTVVQTTLNTESEGGTDAVIPVTTEGMEVTAVTTPILLQIGTAATTGAVTAKIRSVTSLTP